MGLVAPADSSLTRRRGVFSVSIPSRNPSFNEQTMNEINMIPDHLKEGKRVKMVRSVPEEHDDSILIGQIMDKEYHRGTVVSVDNKEVLIMWDGELFPCVTSRKFWHQITPE